MASEPRRSSVIGGFFRRLADFFDNPRGRSLFAGTPREIDIVTLGLIFIGLVTAGSLIHGWHFLFWNILYACAFCAGAWTIFSSARWQAKIRAIIIVLVMLLSIAAASHRIVALAAFIVLFILVLRAMFVGGDFIRRETISVIAVALFCFSSYDAFAGVLEWRRSAILALTGNIPLQCGNMKTETHCKAGEVAFSVPEFWSRGSGSNLIKDLASVAQLKIYADSATDNSVAFAAYSAPPAQVMQQISNFLYVQKGFLRSHGANKETLVPQQIIKSADTQLFGLRYESETLPGYLAENAEFAALILLHERRGTTWLFILDGTDISARDFLLHRIISGFR